jgi:uncharacterized RmlC-like cupin family protein
MLLFPYMSSRGIPPFLSGRDMISCMKINAAVLICCASLAAITVEPRAVLIDNDQVKVLRALEKPHVPGAFHDHKMNRVMVYLQPGTQRFKYQDGRPPKTFEFKAGEVKWSPTEGMHSPEVISEEPFNIIETEIKIPGTGKAIPAELDPLKINPKRYHLEFENRQVRVLRVHLEGHAETPMHRHTLNRVTIFLTDQDFSAKDSSGKVTYSKHKAGDVIWGTPTAHSEVNLSDKPFEAVVIELKG